MWAEGHPWSRHLGERVVWLVGDLGYALTLIALHRLAIAHAPRLLDARLHNWQASSKFPACENAGDFGIHCVFTWPLG